MSAQKEKDEYGFWFEAPSHGIMALDDPLTVERLIAAYQRGIFPWPDDDHLLWVSPDPRFVIPVEKFHIPKSLLRVYKQQKFKLTVDQSFDQVIQRCSSVYRKGQDAGSWITQDIIQHYTALHQLGMAHSVEAWLDGKLAGGLYGVLCGRVFSGESMFTEVTNAGKCAMIRLSLWCRAQGVDIIDCQMETPLMRSFGGRFVSRSTFLGFLGK
jgi:leucyl/phenylalanyl-tRNA--protein transferase